MTVIAHVDTAPVPHTLPATIRPYCRALTGPEGEILDWVPDPRAVLAAGGDSNDILEKIASVRSQWCWERLVGTRNVISDMVRTYWGLGGGPLRVVDELAEELPQVLSGTELDDIAADIADIRAVFNSSDERGIGLYVPGERGSVWVATSPDGFDIAAEAEDGRVVADRDGLWLESDGRRHHLAGWTVDGDEVSLVLGEPITYADAEEGELGEGRMVVPAPVGLAAALRLLAPGADVVRMVRLPYTSIFAYPMVALGDGAAMARKHGSALVIDHGWEGEEASRGVRRLRLL